MKRFFSFFGLLLLLSACTSSQQPSSDELLPDAPSETGSADTPQDLPEGSYELTDSGVFYGEIYARGYIEQEVVAEPFCEENCEEYQGLFLVMQEVGNDQFKAFMQQNAGNAYADEQRVMLGCLEEGTIQYANHSNEFGMKEYAISQAETSEMLAFTEEDPGNFFLKKLPLDGGRGAPACYSHFTEFSVVSE